MELYKSPLIYAAWIPILVMAELLIFFGDAFQQNNQLLGVTILLSFLISGLLMVLGHDIRCSNLRGKFKLSLECILTACILFCSIRIHSFYLM